MIRPGANLPEVTFGPVLLNLVLIKLALNARDAMILLVYALHVKNLVFTLAYLPNGIVYVRNLVLIQRKEARLARTAAD